MATLYEIISELKSTNSSIKKLSILNEQKDNLDLQTFFKYVLHPLKKFGVKKTPAYTPLEKSEKSFHDGITLLDKLNNRELTGNAAINAVADYLNSIDKNDSEIFRMMLERIARCGCSYAIVSKVWPDLLPTEIKLCKAEAYSAKALSKIDWPAYSERKCDGARCLAMKIDGKVEFFSSGYLNYNKLDELASEVSKISDDNFVLDGELLVVDSNEKVLPRSTGNGILNKSLKNTISSEEASRVRFVVWDFIKYDEYESESPTVTYDEVMEFLENTVKDNCLSKIQIIEYKIVNSHEEAFEHFKEMLERGEEGTIVKNRKMKWENARSKNCVKFKIVIDTTMEIVDTFEGTGKYTGQLGGFIVKSSDSEVIVRVGTGISDEERISIWNSRKDYIGRMVEVTSNGLIRATDGTYSLFLPRVSTFRLDKLEADSFETIKALSDGSKMLIKK